MRSASTCAFPIRLMCRKGTESLENQRSLFHLAAILMKNINLILKIQVRLQAANLKRKTQLQNNRKTATIMKIHLEMKVGMVVIQLSSWMRMLFFSGKGYLKLVTATPMKKNKTPRKEHQTMRATHWQINPQCPLQRLKPQRNPFPLQILSNPYSLLLRNIRNRNSPKNRQDPTRKSKCKWCLTEYPDNLRRIPMNPPYRCD